MNTLRILGLPVAFAVLTSALLGSAARAAELEEATYKGQATGTVDFGPGPGPKQPLKFELKVEDVDQQGNVRAVLSTVPVASFICGVPKIELKGTVNSQGRLKLEGTMDAPPDPLDLGEANNTITCKLRAEVKKGEIKGRYEIVRTRTVPGTPMVSTIEINVAFDKATNPD